MAKPEVKHHLPGKGIQSPSRESKNSRRQSEDPLVFFLPDPVITLSLGGFRELVEVCDVCCRKKITTFIFIVKCFALLCLFLSLFFAR